MPRARFTVEEVVQLTLALYRRNYLEVRSSRAAC
jgi:predicted DNA-binding helix-hairpin-helix protein